MDPTHFPLVQGVSVAEAEEIARRITGIVQEPIHLGPRRVSVSASVGVALAVPGADAASLVHHADVAMYAAKRRHGPAGGYAVYDAAMGMAAMARRHRDVELQSALELTAVGAM
jgi:GGDEF domain-containing protein